MSEQARMFREAMAVLDGTEIDTSYRGFAIRILHEPERRLPYTWVASSDVSLSVSRDGYLTREMARMACFLAIDLSFGRIDGDTPKDKRMTIKAFEFEGYTVEITHRVSRPFFPFEWVARKGEHVIRSEINRSRIEEAIADSRAAIREEIKNAS